MAMSYILDASCSRKTLPSTAEQEDIIILSGKQCWSCVS